MTDTAPFESAHDAGNSDDGAFAGAASPAQLAGLSDDNQRIADTKGWDTADKIIDSYRNLEAKIGDSLRPPGNDASHEEWQSFHSRLGCPDTATGYEFGMPEGLAEDFPYDAESAGRFSEWAHEAGLSPRQAQSLHDRFVQNMSGQFTAAQQASETAVDEAHSALVDAWGEPSTERYRRNVELANRALRELGGDALATAFKSRGTITSEGAIADPAIAFMLQKAGERLFSEDQVFSANAAANNPFAKAAENITEQGRLLRSDPELARTFIRAANREHEYPRLFGNEF
jgi:hypothetical protein